MSINILKDDLEYIANYNLPYEKLKGNTVFVTGATGLIGFQLIKALLAIGDIQIVALIRNLNKAQKIYTKEEMQHISFVIGDIVEEINIDVQIDYIFHCAAVTTSKTMINNPVETIITSVNTLFCSFKKSNLPFTTLSFSILYSAWMILLSYVKKVYCLSLRMGSNNSMPVFSSSNRILLVEFFPDQVTSNIFAPVDFTTNGFASTTRPLVYRISATASYSFLKAASNFNLGIIIISLEYFHQFFLTGNAK